MWYACGSDFAFAYISNVLLPDVLGIPVCGIPRITQMMLHLDTTRNEWYASTEGSNLTSAPPHACCGTEGAVELYSKSDLPIDRSRCMSTSIPEMLSCFGLEAVCWMFSSGALAVSLGVNNASCKLLVDHMASRGLWRGINRTSILSPSGVLNNITIEDPTKHLRHASFLGMSDNMKGSSANVLTGGPIDFGTNGFTILLDPEPFNNL